jgi:hypothetical protein
MGGPGHERACVEHECELSPCVVTISYDVPPLFEVWTFQFGKDDRVLSKSHEDLD